MTDSGIRLIGFSGNRALVFWGWSRGSPSGSCSCFVETPGGALIYAIAGLVIFVGLTLFDF